MNNSMTYMAAGLLALTLVGSETLVHGRSGDHPKRDGSTMVLARISSFPDARAESWPTVTARGGSLLLVGGGELPESVRRRFLELAGGKQARIVIIPSASSLPDAPTSVLAEWQTAEVESVGVVHTISRYEADDPRFYGQLRNATGVWISGGDQSRLTAIYGGTAVERELANVLRRGGVVGGTSAGASVVSRVMMADGGKAGTGFGLLSDTIVDQHFSNRGRLPRLLGLLRSHPGQFGIGIDESTAVVIRDGEVSVLGQATVTVARPNGHQPSVRVYPAGSHFQQPTLTSVASR